MVSVVRPRKSNLTSPTELDVVLVELRHRRVGARLRVERAEIGELARRDQHAAGVHADVARQALELLGEREQLAHLFLGGLALVEQRLGFARVNGVRRGLAAAPPQQHRAPGLEGDQLGDAVAETVGQVEHASDIAHHRARRHRAEGGDLRHRLGAVLLLDVFDDAIATVLTEVDVEVRHRYALGIEEPLEQQRVAQRIEIGDAEAVGDQRAGTRAAPGTDRHAVALGPVDEIGDDQKVARIAHLHDRLDLEGESRDVVGPLGVALRGIGKLRGEPTLEPCRRLVLQMLLDASRRAGVGKSGR